MSATGLLILGESTPNVDENLSMDDESGQRRDTTTLLLYEEVSPISEHDWQEVVASNDSSKIASALVSIAFFEPRWKEAQNKCLYFLDGKDIALIGIAATCIGHIARIHHELELETVLPLLHRLQQNYPALGEIGDALDDIAMFIPKRTLIQALAVSRF